MGILVSRQPPKDGEPNYDQKMKVYTMLIRKAVSNVIFRDDLITQVKSQYDASDNVIALSHAVLDVVIKIANDIFGKTGMVDIPTIFIIGGLAIEDLTKVLNASGRPVTEEEIGSAALKSMVAYMTMIKGRYDQRVFRMYMESLHQRWADGSISSIHDMRGNINGVR